MRPFHKERRHAKGHPGVRLKKCQFKRGAETLCVGSVSPPFALVGIRGLYSLAPQPYAPRILACAPLYAWLDIREYLKRGPAISGCGPLVLCAECATMAPCWTATMLARRMRGPFRDTLLSAKLGDS